MLKISVCGIYDYSTDKYSIFEEHEIPKLSPILQTCDQIIGFNIIDFDFEVLQPYLSFPLSEVPALDLLVEVGNALGHRIKLEDIATATLGKGKSGSGLEAIQHFRLGRMGELKKYCLDDVKVTKNIYEYALKNGKLLYKDFFKTKEIPLKIEDAKQRQGIMHQAALF